MLLPGAARAVVFPVTKTADTNDGACDADCSLREAIVAANAAATDDTVNLPASPTPYTLTITGSDDLAAMGDLDIAANGKLTLIGGGARTTTVNGNAIDRVLDVRTDATAEISDVTITGGDPTGSGGGILNDGTLTVTNSTIRNNGPAFDGGGIYNDDAVSLTVASSTINGNQATRDGGGIRVLNGPVTVTNSTISDNTTSDDGGGIQMETTPSLTVTNSTIAFNTAGISGGGVWLSNSFSNKTLNNTLLSNNTSPSGPNCVATTNPTSGTHNLESGTDCAFTATGGLQNANADLGPLQDNGGPTDTHALGPGSQAIDAANPANCPSVDQRGVARVGICDIGAFEFVPPMEEPVAEDTTPPETTITRKPRNKTKKKTATFEFVASEPATFTCTLDGRDQFKPCTSPTKVKVKKGRHKFEVRAMDAAGNADPTPASDRWKRKKKRR
jgi:CSLREA domain-containing protein